MSIDVFLSGLQGDQPHTDRLYDALERSGLVVWCPARDLLPGDKPDEVIPKAMADSKVLVFVVTDHWPQPGEVHPEWDRAEEIRIAIKAAQSTGKRTFPVLLDGAEPDRIPYGLNRPHPLYANRSDITAAAHEIAQVAKSPVENAEASPSDRHSAGRGPDPGPIHVIRLTAPVGDQTRIITDDEVHHACRPARPVDGGLSVELASPADGSDQYPFVAWADQLTRQVRGFLEHRVPPSRVNRLGVFGFAPIPLLMMLGRVIGDQHPTTLFERHRHTQTWRWDEAAPGDFALALDRPGPRPKGEHADIAILVSISDRVKRWAVEAAVPGPLDIYEIRAQSPRVNLIRTRAQLAEFARVWRAALDSANDRSRGKASVHVFAAAPISVAMQMGLGMLPKADPPLEVYDFRDRAFHHALTIGPP